MGSRGSRGKTAWVLLVLALGGGARAEDPPEEVARQVLAVTAERRADERGRRDDAAMARLADAVERAERTLGRGHPVAVFAGLCLADDLRFFEDYAGASALCDRHLPQVDLLPEQHPSTLPALEKLGFVLWELGRYADSYVASRRALDLAERRLPADDPTRGRLLTNVAGALLYQGEAQAALPLMLRSLEVVLRHEGPDAYATGDAHNNLGAVYSRLGRHAEAIPHHERAAEIRRRTTPFPHVAAAHSLIDLAASLEGAGRREDARARLAEALRVFETPGIALDPHWVTGQLHLGRLHELDGRQGEAKVVYERALARLSEGALPQARPEFLEARSRLAAVCAKVGELDRSRALFAQVLDEAEGLASRSLARLSGAPRVALLRLLRARLDAYLESAETLGTTGYDEVLRFKGFVARADAAERRLLRADPVTGAAWLARIQEAEREVNALAGAAPSKRDGGDGLPAGERRRRFGEWQDRYALALRTLDERRIAMAAALAPQREADARRGLRTAEVAGALAEGEVLVDLLATRGRYAAWVVARDATVTRVDLGPADPVDRAAAELLRLTEDEATAIDSAEWLAAGRSLHAAVWAPLRERFPPGTRTVCLSPDGALAAVPWTALPEEGGFLGERHRLVLLSMAQDLVRWPGERSRGAGALLVGGVDYGGSVPIGESERVAALADAELLSARGSQPRALRGVRFEPIPGTAAEIAGLARRLPDARVLPGAAATEARLRREAAGRRIVHLATHGFVPASFELDAPAAGTVEGSRWIDLVRGRDPLLACGLALAGVNLRDGGNGDDGFLTAAEASAMDLDAADLVVLSACDSARGKSLAGEGVLGLVHGFQAAGARAVVASLWKVDDEATRRLMDRFYAALLADPEASPSAALSRAAADLRASGDPSLTAPRHWAAFAVYERR